MKYLSLLLVGFLMVSCKKEQRPKVLSADEIVNRSLEVSGLNKLSDAILSFEFRDKSYYAKRQDGYFQLARSFHDSTSVSISEVRDVLDNRGFRRFLDGKEIVISDSIKTKFAASVNSVHYFSVLPYGLNDAAVKKNLKEDIQINGEIYHTIQITFDEQGGGEDFDDVFLYWINSETYELDFLAYSYNEDDGIGLRFREAFNERTIDGVRFVDYNNYKPKNQATNLNELMSAFQREELTLLSKIELKKIQVNSN